MTDAFLVAIGWVGSAARGVTLNFNPAIDMRIVLIGFGLMLFGWGGMIGLTVTLRREGEPWSEVRAALFDPRSHVMFVLGLVGAMLFAVALTQ